jgi:hypothetical protein
MQLVFFCANDTLVTDMTSALAIPSAAANFITAVFITLSPCCMCPKYDVPKYEDTSAAGPNAWAARTPDR